MSIYICSRVKGSSYTVICLNGLKSIPDIYLYLSPLLFSASQTKQAASVMARSWMFSFLSIMKGTRKKRDKVEGTWISSSLSITKRTRKKRKKLGTSIESLPHALLTEVMAQVASTSLVDLSRLKLSCKYFLQAADDDFVFEHASLDKFYVVWPMTDRHASLFLMRCKKSGNPEALYRQGMHDYFSLGLTNSGFRLLKRAADKKHPEATYVYTIIMLLCCGSQFKKQGFELLSSLKSTYGIRECRTKIRAGVINSLWIRNITVDQHGEYSAETCDCLRTRMRGWDDGLDKLIGSCESCLCVTEVNFFCDLLRSSSCCKEWSF